MTPTRRHFLSRAAMAAAALGLDPRPGGRLVLNAERGESPLASLVARFREDQANHVAGWSPTGLNRHEYLRLMEGIVRFFATCQDARGAIIDPFEHQERQYSTPAFALAGAVLCTSGLDTNILPAAVRAMTAACADLAGGKAADGHADFFTVLLMHADRLLHPIAGASTSAPWRRDLSRIVPERVYRRQPTDTTINNWNLVAAAGEWLRTRDGFGTSGPWIEASLARQMEHFTDCGMYRDPNDPMAYDHFARLWVLDLLDEGYRGVQAATLGTLVERGAWASLLMQSPWGELPCGGRSAHHQWNEAEQAVTFESFARRFASCGDAAAARACKRAAHLAAQSIGRWVRPSGELWVVKNRMDPGLRHGYESYSFHSQYNLVTAAMLAIAWMRADDGIPEAPCPADTGGFAFALQPPFHKVFVNAAGAYVEIDTGSDPHYNPTGILRLHHRGMPPETLSDGVSASADYTLPSKPSRSLALGPAWRDSAGAWHALADHAGGDLDPVDFKLVRSSTSLVEIALVHRGRLRGGGAAVTERIRVGPDLLEIEHRVDGDLTAVRQVWPFLRTDGAAASSVTVGGAVAEVTRGRSLLRFESTTAGARVGRFDVNEPCRNGFADAAWAECAGASIRCRIGWR